MRKTIELGTVILSIFTLAACEGQRTEPTPAEREPEPQRIEPVPTEQGAPGQAPAEQRAPEERTDRPAPGGQGEPGEPERAPDQPMFEDRENIEPPPSDAPEARKDGETSARDQGKESFRIPGATFTAEDARTRAQATLRDKDGKVMGTATFIVVPFGVAMTFEGENLPAGTHGFHIHETGRCDPPTFESAGEHFNPTDTGHGFADPEDAFHLGDLPNLEVGEDGTAAMHYLLPGLNLKAGHPASLLDEDGSALVLHADPDDYASEPSGNAGARIGCGVVQKTSPDVG